MEGTHGSDSLDLSEEPEEPEPLGSPAPQPPPAGGGTARAPGPSSPRGRGNRTLGIVLVVVLVLVVVIAGSVYYFALRPHPSSTTVPPPLVYPCLGDKAGNWPTYLGEVSRNSANCGEHNLSSSNAARLGLLWSFNTSWATPGVLQAEPVVANGTVYIGGGNGTFFALNATTGQLVWESPNLGTDVMCNYPDGLTSSATVAGGRVYVGGGNGYFYALNESTGQIAWSYLIGPQSLGYYNWASPLVLPALGYIYLGVSSNCDRPLVNGGLDQLSIATHQLVSFFSALSPLQAAACNNTLPPPHNVTAPGCGGSIWGSASYDPATNTVWAATGNGYVTGTPLYSDSLMEWNASTLALVSHWQVPNAAEITDGDFGTTPTLVDLPNGTAMVYATNKNGWFYAFDRADLSHPVWQYQISTTPSVSPAAYGAGLVYVGGHRTVVNGAQSLGSIRAFDPTGNKTVWTVAMPGEVVGAPVYTNGLLIVAGGNVMKVLNASTGALLYSYTASQPFVAAPAVAGGVVYIGNTNGLVLAFGLPAGTIAVGTAGGAATLPGTALGSPSEGPATPQLATAPWSELRGPSAGV